MASVLKRLDNGTLELTLTVPWSDLQKAYDIAVDEEVAKAEIKGFRKGKAPRKLVEDRLDRNHTLSHAVQHALPPAYAEAVKEHNLKPVLYPQIRIEKGTEGEDWVFVATTCEAPAVTMPDYKKAFNKDQKLEEKIEFLVKNATLTIPDLLAEEEANHRISALVENITQLGMTTDQYLATKKMNAEQLKVNMITEAREGLKLEFILLEIQKQEKLENRQKVLDFITALV